jgi:hypothetical protein
MRDQKNKGEQHQDVITQIGKFIHLDQLDDKDAKYYT